MGDRKRLVQAVEIASPMLGRGVPRDEVIVELQKKAFSKHEAKRAVFESLVTIRFYRDQKTWGEVKTLLKRERWPRMWIIDAGIRRAGELIEWAEGRRMAGVEIAKLLREQGYGKYAIFDRLSDIGFLRETGRTRRTGMIYRLLRGVKETEYKEKKIHRFICLINREGLAVSPEPLPALQTKPLTVRIFGEVVLALWQFSRGKSAAAEKFADRLPLDFLEWPDPEPGFFGRMWDRFEDNLPKILFGYVLSIPALYIVSKLMGY